jgi:hypothetical protein
VIATLNKGKQLMESRLLARQTFTASLVVVWVFVVILMSARPVHSAPPHDDPVPGSATLDMILNTIIPPRDRIDLARRLLGVTDIPAPPTVAPPELQIGDVQTFWADNVEQDFSFQVNAELVYKTEHVYMFVEVGWDIDRRRSNSRLRRLRT